MTSRDIPQYFNRLLEGRPAKLLPGGLLLFLGNFSAIPAKPREWPGAFSRDPADERRPTKMHENLTVAVRAEMEREHNVMAAALSLLLPGLGHAYKGQYGAAMTILLFGGPLALWVGVLLSLATLGLGMLIPIGFWAMTAFCAYYAEDHRARHA